MKIIDEIIEAAEKRGAKDVKVNIGKTNASLSVNGLVRMTGHKTAFQEPDTNSLLKSVKEHDSLLWMNT